MPAQTLRPYQKDGVAKTFASWRGGLLRILLILATGGGKTTMFSFIAGLLAAKQQRTLVLVHRRELATQAAARFEEFGVDFGFIMPGKPMRLAAPVQIAMVPTLVRRMDTDPALQTLFKSIRVLICDEAHLSTAATWQEILRRFPQALLLGVTATPWRLSGKPLVGAYDSSIVVATPRELREAGFLCHYVGFSYLAPDLTLIKTTAGEYNEKQSSEAMRQPNIVDNVVEQWLAHASDLSTVVFAVTVEHSRELCAKFRAAGVTAEHLDGKTHPDQRKAILRRVETGQTRVLCNVGVAVEGLDIPRLKCCILARPTKSLARAIQMMGRVRRPVKRCLRCKEDYKIDFDACPKCNCAEFRLLKARIHDHSFNLKEHGLPDDDRDYSLNARKARPPSLTTCDVCRAIYASAKCPDCNKAAKTEPGKVEVVGVDDAERFEFESGNELEAIPMPRNTKPIVIRWDRPGREVEGVLAKTWEEDTVYGRQRRWLLSGPKRDYTLPGTVDLNAKLNQVALSRLVKVTYLDEKPVGTRNKKLFKVEVAP